MNNEFRRATHGSGVVERKIEKDTHTHPHTPPPHTHRERERERGRDGGRERERERERERKIYIYIYICRGAGRLVEGKGEVKEVWGREAQQVPLNY